MKISNIIDASFGDRINEVWMNSNFYVFLANLFGQNLGKKTKTLRNLFHIYIHIIPFKDGTQYYFPQFSVDDVAEKSRTRSDHYWLRNG